MRQSIFPADVETALADGMRRAQTGDRAAYASVLAQCREVFGRLAHERCPAGYSEVEIVHRCLVTLHEARHTFDPRRSFGAWVGAVARHHGIGPAPVGERLTWWARIGMPARGIGGRKEASSV